MRKEILALLLFLFVMTNYGCRNKAIIGTQIPDFPKVYSLAGEDLPWINLLNPINMVVSDSLLIIEDNSSPYYFYIFNIDFHSFNLPYLTHVDFRKHFS